MFGQGGFLDHADTVANITLFAKEVLPRLRELNAEPKSGGARGRVARLAWRSKSTAANAISGRRRNPRASRLRARRPLRRSPLSFRSTRRAGCIIDFRLELDGVLKSWAVPKGPSLDPGEKRLAVEVEDHPLDYGGFEGVIPEGQYGGGTVLLWDRGTWVPADPDPAAAHAKGMLKFELHGEKLHGNWALVRMGGKAARERRPNWLLVKERDDAAVPQSGDAVVADNPLSVESGRSLEAIASDRDRVWDSQKGEATPARTV